MANGKTAGDPAEKPGGASAEKAAESGGGKSSGRRNRRGKPQERQQDKPQEAQRDKPQDNRQDKPQAETQGGPDRLVQAQERPGGERRGTRQSASRGGRQGVQRNGRQAESRPGSADASGRTVSGRQPGSGTVEKSFFKRTWRDYVLQLSVVILGIVVTFAGSALIERSRQARDVRAAMMLVHSELEANRMKIHEVWDWIQREADAYRILAQNRHDLTAIPQDTMASFVPVFGRVLSFHPRQDAFEVLKNSGLMASVRDKDFLLAVTQGYATLAELEENVGMYFKLKAEAQGDMSKAFSSSQREIYYSGDMYGMWNCILSVPSSYDFVLSAPYVFPEGYTEGLLRDVDRAVRAIEAKYETDKKQTDD